MFTSARTSKVFRTGAALALAFTGLAGPVAHADNLNPVLGGGLGAMAGAFIGQSMGGRDGALIGAAVGGVAGVSLASEGDHRRYQPPRTVAYQESYSPAPAMVYQQAYRAPPVVVYQEPYRVVERVNYYPVHDYGRHGWEHHEHGWERHGDYRHDGDHHGWDRRD